MSQAKFLVYKSSAGSGKTFTLVKEYLKLALSDPKRIEYNFKAILALTFTNKAAAEMRTRIVAALKSISESNENSILQQRLENELKVDKTELEERSQILLQCILHHYSDFGVSTIDSFSHRIIKTFAHDLELPVNFNLETDTDEFYDRVIAKLLNEIGKNDEVTSLLKEYVLNNLDENVTWDPQQKIEEFAKTLQKESALPHLNKLTRVNPNDINEFKKEINQFIKEFHQNIIGPAQEAQELIKINNLNTEDFTNKSNGPQNLFKKCINYEFKEHPANKTLISTLEKGNWGGTGLTDEKKKIFEKINPKLNELAEKIVKYYNLNIKKYNLYKLIGSKIYPILLLGKIQEIVNEIKSDEQLVFIEEFNSKIFEFIKNEPISFIYERLGEKYKHFLIDEFQDTSTLQWQNILPLVENSLASGNLNLLVGDGKQSIYRWRNANVSQFVELPKIENPENDAILAEREHALIRNYKEQVLNENYRSLKNIINFNNSFFEFQSNQQLVTPYKNIYQNHQQKSINSNLGYVSIVKDKKPKDELNDFILQQTLNRIHSALTLGFHYNDICIITSKNIEGSLIANFLNKNGIPVVSNDSLLLTNSPEVNLIVSFFKYLHNNKDHIQAASVFNYLFVSNKINASQYHNSLVQLSTKGLFKTLLDIGIEIHVSKLQTLNLLDCATHIIETLKLNENKTAVIYLRFFIDEISKFIAKNNSDLTEFNTWWEKRALNASLIISENLNAVKIMTIHKSKGLEFPVVIIPFCNWGFKDTTSWVNLKNEKIPVSSAYIKMDKQAENAGFETEVETERQEVLLDNLNKMYVAFTRAVEHLHIIACVSEKHTKPGVHKWIENFITESSLLIANKNIFELGEPSKKSTTHSELNNSIIEINALPINNNSEAVKIKNSYYKNSNVTLSAREKGILIHYLLSKIKHVEDIDSSLKNAAIKGELNVKEIPEYKQLLINLLSQKAIEKYFSKDYKIKMECEIMSRNGEILRPDRICISNIETCIIDFKTGAIEDKKYNKQMLNYQQALEDLNYKNIKKILVYTEESKVIELS